MSIQSRLKQIQDAVLKEREKHIKYIWVSYKDASDNINHNKIYWFKYDNKDLVYNNMEDFYKEYNVYPNKDIKPIFFEIVDNSHLEKFLYQYNKSN